MPHRSLITAVLVAIIFFATDTAPAQSFVVTNAIPSGHTVGAARSAPIVVDFNSAIAPGSVTNQSFRVFGRWSGPANGQLDVSGQTATFTPSQPFFAGELVTVSLSTAIEDNSGNNLDHGFQWSYWTAVSGGSLDFVYDSEIDIREPGEGAILSYGAYAGDINNDGWSDLMIPNEGPNDFRVFLNDGAGNYSDFVIYNMPSSSQPSTNEGADFNGDGEIDIAIGSGAGRFISVFMGSGDGTFGSENPVEAGPTGAWVRSICVADADGDGFDDMISTTRDHDKVAVILNNGNGTFGTPTHFEANGDSETTCAAADVNGDGITDFFIGSFSSSSISLMLGDGDGGLVFSDSITVDGFPWMSAAGDLNGDGIPDVVTAGFTGRNISIVTADASGSLTSHTSYIAGDAVLAVDLGDLDADGDLDVVTSNLSSNDFTIFENDGSGNLTIFGTLQSSSAGSCAILHDRDNDGDLDITGIDESDDVILLYSNPNTIGVEGLRLSSFVEDHSVALFWSTTAEENNAGFDVQRQTGPARDTADERWSTLDFVAASTNEFEQGRYSFVDRNPLDGTSSYRLRQVDHDGTFSFSNVVEISVHPTSRFNISEPFPNPFTQTTTVSISSESGDPVSVSLFDITGRTVRTLGFIDSSNGSLESIEISGTGLPAGLYFIKVSDRYNTQILPVTLVK